MSEHKQEIRKATVIGAGSMGSGIAAQLANSGVLVYLLDIVPQNATDRNVIAKNAIQRMLKALPATDPLNAGFMHPSNAERVRPGNIEDNLQEAVEDADWIIEVVIENLAVKQDLFVQLERLARPDAIISSNTSTIPLKDLVEGRSEAFKTRFIITHFFNPPRFMHLLEVVGGQFTDPEILALIRDFGDTRLGKNVILCKDTPAFLANRIGIYFMFRAITETIERNIKIQEVDALLGTPIGFPKEGIFGLLDLVGIGIIPLVTESLLKTLADDDPFRQFDHDKGLTLINGLLRDGRTGRNATKGGFYRMEKLADGGRQKQVLDLNTGDYFSVEKKLKLECLKVARRDGPRALFECGDGLGDFAWVVVRDTLLYAASLIPEIADDIADVDAALRGGYNARWGPFEQIDQLGVGWFCEKVMQAGLTLPPVLRLAQNRPFYTEKNGKPYRLVFDLEKQEAHYAELLSAPGILKLENVKRNARPLVTHYSASLWDIGDGVTCFEFHSKMNTLDPSTLWTLNQSIQFMVQNSERYRAMVIYNEAKNFSLGANLGLLDAGFQASASPWAKKLGLSNRLMDVVEAMIVQGQNVFNALRKAPFPVIGAPNGMALGGGCEILLHCDRLQASAETYMGLVESGVGLIPGWGGCLRYLERCRQSEKMEGGTLPPVRAAFQAILMPQLSVSISAQDAKLKRWLRPQDGITMNPERLLSDAKAAALSMVGDYQPPEPYHFQLPGPAGRSALNMAIDDFYVKGDATYHDVVVADALAEVLTGGETQAGKLISESELAQLERENFMSLLMTQQSRKRIAHTLKTGKPLREDPGQNERTLEAIRAGRKPLRLPFRTLSDTPLSGAEAIKLRAMAEVTALLLKRFAK